MTAPTPAQRAAVETALSDARAALSRADQAFAALFAAPPVTTPPAPPAPVQPASPTIKAEPRDGAVLVTWTSSSASVVVGRDGQDTTGGGPWSTADVPNGSRLFDKLKNGTQYVFSVNAGGVIMSTMSKPAAAATTTPTAPVPATPATPPPIVTGGTLKTQKLLTLPKRGFFSGSSGYGDKTMNNGESAAHAGDFFGNWRGDPTDFFATWQDHEGDKADGIHWGWGPSYTKTVGMIGLLDMAPGGPSNYTAAAGGSLDVKWRDYLTRLRVGRTVNGKLQPTIIRPCHEMNGDWYPWSVRVGQESPFADTMARWRKILDEVFPEAIFALCFNGDTSTYDLDIAKMYRPGTWDLIGVDQYNTWPYIATEAKWTEQLNATKGRNPRGIDAWRKWAGDRGLPLYHPEVAHGGADGDSDLWVKKYFAWCKANGGLGAGQFLGTCWFNIGRGGYGDAYWMVDGKGENTKIPKVVAAYKNIFPM